MSVMKEICLRNCDVFVTTFLKLTLSTFYNLEDWLSVRTLDKNLSRLEDCTFLGN